MSRLILSFAFVLAFKTFLKVVERKEDEDEEEEDDDEEDEVEEDTFGFLWEVNEVTMTRDRFFRSRFSTKFKRKFSSL